MEVVPFPQRELANVGIAANPRKKMAAMPPKAHAPTLEEITCSLKDWRSRRGSGWGGGGWSAHR